MPCIDTLRNTLAVLQQDCSHITFKESGWTWKKIKSFRCWKFLAELPDCNGQSYETSHLKTPSRLQLQKCGSQMPPCRVHYLHQTSTSKPKLSVIWEGCCTRIPNPIWRQQALKHPPVINNLMADEETRICILLLNSLHNHWQFILPLCNTLPILVCCTCRCKLFWVTDEILKSDSLNPTCLDQG